MKEPIPVKQSFEMEQIFEELDAHVLDESTQLHHLTGRLFDKTVKRLTRRWTGGDRDLATLVAVLWFFNVTKKLRATSGINFLKGLTGDKNG